jgi:hypothetical protein
MTGVKWAGILCGTLTFALVGLANVLLASLTRYAMPAAVNDLGAGVAAASTVIAFGAHMHGLTERKLDRILDLFATRVEELENRVGDYNTGFVEGYLASQGRETMIAPVPHHLTRRGVHDG